MSQVTLRTTVNTVSVHFECFYLSNLFGKVLLLSLLLKEVFTFGLFTFFFS